MHRILKAIQDDRAGTRTIPSLTGRRLQDSDSCDARFIYCLDNNRCRGCFDSLALEDIDWTGLAPGTECSEVIGFLTNAGHCTDLIGDTDATNAFCDTFDSCVVWTDDDNYWEDDDKAGMVDCELLTECYWEGMHPGWLNDGTCHDNIDGCYNTEICGYDGGDCCSDTCEEDVFSTYVHCGLDGYACKDPASDYCNSKLTTKCPKPAPSGAKPSDKKCGDDESKHRLVLYDSFGDGWDATTLTITAEDDKTNIVFQGGLQDGYESTEYICLSKEPKCYNAVALGGSCELLC